MLWNGLAKKKREREKEKKEGRLMMAMQKTSVYLARDSNTRTVGGDGGGMV